MTDRTRIFCYCVLLEKHHCMGLQVIESLRLELADLKDWNHYDPPWCCACISCGASKVVIQPAFPPKILWFGWNLYICHSPSIPLLIAIFLMNFYLFLRELREFTKAYPCRKPFFGSNIVGFYHAENWNVSKIAEALLCVVSYFRHGRGTSWIFIKSFVARFGTENLLFMTKFRIVWSKEGKTLPAHATPSWTVTVIRDQM